MKQTIFILVFCWVHHAWAQETTSYQIEQEGPQSVSTFLEEHSESIFQQEFTQEELYEKEFFETQGITTEQLYDQFRQEIIKSEAYDPAGLEGFKGLTIDPYEAIGIGAQTEVVDRNERIGYSRDLRFIGEMDISDSIVLSRLERGVSTYDSRVELWELSPLIPQQQQILENSRSVGIVVHREKFEELTDSLYTFDFSVTLDRLLCLCPNEQYRNQVSLGVGTAFIIGEDEMVTASHVFEGDIDEYLIIFNFEIINKADAVTPIISERNVYHITEVLSEDQELDVVKFRVNKPLKAPALKLSNQKRLKRGEGVYMIGHPSGLPKKVALNARVNKDNHSHYFFSTLDAYQGNSGSPVFSLKTHEVVGILVSGSQDFRWTGSCNESTVCEIPYCDGEKAIRIEQVLIED